MAKAAAKKVAAGKADAERFYKPFLVGVNSLYAILQCLRLGGTNGIRSFVSVQSLAIHALLAALQWYAYIGILDQHANVKNSAKNTKNSGDLVGGASLDLLGLVLVIQFGALFVSTKLYYGLVIVPVWGVYSVYTTWFAKSPVTTAGREAGDAKSPVGVVERRTVNMPAGRRKKA